MFFVVETSAGAGGVGTGRSRGDGHVRKTKCNSGSCYRSCITPL